MLKPNSKVRHRKFPEWKKGTIEKIEDGKALVRFPYRFYGVVWVALKDLKKIKPK